MSPYEVGLVNELMEAKLDIRQLGARFAGNCQLKQNHETFVGSNLQPD